MLTLAQASDMTGALAAYKLALAEECIAELKGRLEEMRQERDRARAGEDAWKAQCEAVTRQIALPAPHDAQTAQQPSPLRRARQWMRTGVPAKPNSARACCSPYRPCPRVLNSSSRNSSSRNSRRRRDASRLR